MTDALRQEMEMVEDRVGEAMEREGTMDSFVPEPQTISHIPFPDETHIRSRWEHRSADLEEGVRNVRARYSFLLLE